VQCKNLTSNNDSSSSGFLFTGLFKKRRVGVSTVSATSTDASNSLSNPSGLSLMTLRCTKVEEVEIGYDLR
jgi:hypothetical protein